MQSLYKFLKEKKTEKGIRTSLENFGQVGNVDIFPMYAISNLIRIRKIFIHLTVLAKNIVHLQKISTMKLQLPFFPERTKLINDSLGFYEQEGVVYYLHNGTPIFRHSNYDWNSFRFILANVIVNKLCKVNELSKATGIGRDNIEYYAKMLHEKGPAHFFTRKERRGKYIKMTPDKMAAVQKDLDDGVSIYRAALSHAVSETTIHFHIRIGNLKRKIIKAR